MTGLWVFDRVADGLLFSRPRHLARIHRRDALLDIRGVPLAADTADDVTTWRSYRAFSGRCGLVAQREDKNENENESVDSHENSHDDYEKHDGNGGGDVPHPESKSSPHACRVSRSPHDYHAWVLDLYLRSTSEDPHILLTVAPHYSPLEGNIRRNKRTWRPPTRADQEVYDKMMLETPLVWENPMALSVDCTASGMYVWSEEWQMYGEKVADKCFSRHSQSRSGDDMNAEGNMNTEREDMGGAHEALVRLTWRLMSPGEDDGRGGEQRCLHDMSVESAAAAPRHGEITVFIRTSNSERANNGNLSTWRQSSGGNGSEAAHDGERVSSEAQVWKRAVERTVSGENIPDGVYFTPYVTLMDYGDEVTLL